MLEWRKQVGDPVAVDDILVEISTDKVDAELPSPVAGTLSEILVQADETVAVGTILCRIAAGAGAAPAAPGPVAPAAEPKAGAPAASAPATPPGLATPVAARVASAHGVDVSSVRGSGPRGRVTKEDVLAAVQGNGAPQAPAPPEGATAVPIRGPAATLARFMDESRSIPTATSFRTLPVDLLDARRKDLKAAGKKLSFTHLIAWAIVKAAADWPVMGHSYAEEGGKPQRIVPGEPQPRPGRGRGAQGRHPLARGARDPRGFRARLRRFRRQLRRAGGRRARQQARPRRLPGRERDAHQPRRPRHRGVGAAPHARPGHDRRHRRDRLPARAHRGRARAPARARRAEGHDDDQHLRPPRDPGCGVRVLPAPDRRAAAGRGRLLRRGVRGGRADRARGGRGGPDRRYGRRAGAGRRHPRGQHGARRRAAPGSAGGHLAGQGSPDARPPRRAARSARLGARGRSGARAGERGAHAGADAPHPGLGAEGGGARRDLRRRSAPPARDLRGHDGVRGRAHLRPQAAGLAAAGDRVRHLPPAASAGGEAAPARAPVQRRGARELPAQGLPREEAVLDRGSRRARADARRDHRDRVRQRRPRGRPGHGPPRAAERAGAHRRAPLRDRAGRVRGRADAGSGDRGARGRHRRREVPLRRLGHLQDAGRQGRDRHALPEPEPPRVRESGDRGTRASGPDLAQGARADPRSELRAAGADPRRRRVPRPGRGGRDAQPPVAPGVLHGRHAARDRQQPAGLHHRSRREPLHALRLGPGQGLRRADHPRERR